MTTSPPFAPPTLDIINDAVIAAFNDAHDHPQPLAKSREQLLVMILEKWGERRAAAPRRAHCPTCGTERDGR